jgi:hypothetical protein
MFLIGPNKNAIQMTAAIANPRNYRAVNEFTIFGYNRK